MKHLAHPLLPLALLASVGPAVGQGNIYFVSDEVYMLPVQGLNTASFTTSVAGHLQGYRLNDAVVLASGTPVLVTAPGLHRSALPLPLPAVLPTGYVPNDVRDLAILRAGGEEGRDALVMVTGAGLWTWHMGKETVTPPGGAPVVQWVVRMNALGTSVWAGAKRLRVADVNNDGIDDVLGIMSAERAIRCLQRDAAGTTWVIPANGHVRDFVVADVVAGGLPEIVAAIGPITSQSFGGGLRVFAPGNSTALMQVNLPHDSGVCAPLRAGTVTGVVIASSQNGVNGQNATHWLHSFEAVDGSLVQRDSASLAAEVTAVTSGLWRTAEEEVLLTYRTTSNPAAVAQNGSLMFGPIRSVSFGSAAMTDNRAACLLADWHGDPLEPEVGLRGAPRLLYPSTSVSRIILQQTTSWDSRFVTVDGHPSSFGVVAPFDPRVTHVEVGSWGLALTSSSLTMPYPTGRSQLALLNNSGTAWSIDASVVDPAASAWMLSLRFVAVDAAGVVVKRWPSRIACAAVDGTWLALLMQEFPQMALAPRYAAMFQQGITGDVVQPPAGPDTDDEEPPKPGTGG